VIDAARDPEAEATAHEEPGAQQERSERRKRRAAAERPREMAEDEEPAVRHVLLALELLEGVEDEAHEASPGLALEARCGRG
jgi:hypothetical protein